MGERRGSVRTAEGQRCPAMSPLPLKVQTFQRPSNIVGGREELELGHFGHAVAVSAVRQRRHRQPRLHPCSG
eukprot:scaffold4699_cov145-Isochrysis_galbana.AAC.1